MAIRFACKCGKPLQAQEGFAGRKMRCPACGAVLTIPDTEGQGAMSLDVSSVSPPPIPAASPPPAVPSEPRSSPVSFEEHEDILMARDAGKIAERDTAGKAGFPAEAGSAKPAQPKPASPPARPTTSDDVWADRSLTQEITPWPVHDKVRAGAITERERGGAGRWVLVLVLLVVVAGAVAGWIFRDNLARALEAHAQALQKSEEIANRNPWNTYRSLDVLPEDAPYFLSIRGADLWEKAKGLSLPDPAQQRLEKWLEKLTEETRDTTGLKPNQIERITVFATENPLNNLRGVEPPLTLVESVQPYDEMRFRNSWFPPVAQQGETTKYYVVDKGNGIAIAFLNDHLYLLGPTQTVVAFIKEPPVGKAGNSSRAGFLNKHPLSAHLTLQPGLKEMSKALKLPPLLEPVRVFFEAKSVDVGADVDTHLNLDVFLHFPKEQEAAAAAVFLSWVRLFGPQGLLPQEAQQERAMALLRLFLEKLEHEARKDTLQMSWKLDEVAIGLLLEAADNIGR